MIQEIENTLVLKMSFQRKVVGVKCDNFAKSRTFGVKFCYTRTCMCVLQNFWGENDKKTSFGYFCENMLTYVFQSVCLFWKWNKLTKAITKHTFGIKH